MNTFSRVICLAVYVLALATLDGTFLAGSATVLQYGAIALLAAHAIEVVVCYKYVKLYKGPIAVSIVLTLLFGLLHWKPLANAAARKAAT
ncbi:MAG: hypothetical protein IPO13_14275 [Rhodocyclaceae bacterium]|nr:hypothetical protein [Rhodocyclaceae bacterium]